MPQTRVLLTSFLVLCLLAGCGKRGSLYLPGERDAPPPATEQQEQAEPAADNTGE